MNEGSVTLTPRRTNLAAELQHLTSPLHIHRERRLNVIRKIYRRSQVQHDAAMMRHERAIVDRHPEVWRRNFTRDCYEFSTKIGVALVQAVPQGLAGRSHRDEALRCIKKKGRNKM
jgi:hypothetical protein